jgi:hypothetical protein
MGYQEGTLCFTKKSQHQCSNRYKNVIVASSRKVTMKTTTRSGDEDFTKSQTNESQRLQNVPLCLSLQLFMHAAHYLNQFQRSPDEAANDRQRGPAVGSGTVILIRCCCGGRTPRKWTTGTAPASRETGGVEIFRKKWTRLLRGFCFLSLRCFSTFSSGNRRLIKIVIGSRAKRSCEFHRE